MWFLLISLKTAGLALKNVIVFKAFKRKVKECEVF
jgi:hypothetical protein